jgi:hypothetical protein
VLLLSVTGPPFLVRQEIDDHAPNGHMAEDKVSDLAAQGLEMLAEIGFGYAGMFLSGE